MGRQHSLQVWRCLGHHCSWSLCPGLSPFPVAGCKVEFHGGKDENRMRRGGISVVQQEVDASWTGPGAVADLGGLAVLGRIGTPCQSCSRELGAQTLC